MQTFLFILIIVAAIGALVSVVRGVIIFMQTQHDGVHGNGPIESGLKQNKMMWRRIQFQAIAIIAIVLFLLMARGGHAS